MVRLGCGVDEGHWEVCGALFLFTSVEDIG